jgi:hypothetical protein
MKLTVLDQYAQGVRHYDHEIGERLRDQVERLKWSLWHEHLEKALGKIEDIASSMAPLEETASQSLSEKVTLWLRAASPSGGSWPS